MSFMVLYVHRNLWFIRDGGGGGWAGGYFTSTGSVWLIGDGGRMG